MKSYTVEIKETLARCIRVNAECEFSAIEQAKKKYYQEDIVLGCEDHMTTDYKIIDEVTRFEHKIDKILT